MEIYQNTGRQSFGEAQHEESRVMFIFVSALNFGEDTSGQA
jgi:hypothetical protein